MLKRKTTHTGLNANESKQKQSKKARDKSTKKKKKEGIHGPRDLAGGDRGGTKKDQKGTGQREVGWTIPRLGGSVENGTG